ncbi:MAG: MoxR family ATPase [Candidatus Omnitrophica bacterium]|nr:MoxR family ATPase [Candidatus Omnitrophota bacterium]
MTEDREQINELVEKESGFCRTLVAEMETVIVGQMYLLERLIVGLLAGGHVLVESVPGLAKTLSIMSLSNAIEAQFQRIQFTPDLLPADIVGTLIYNPKEATFVIKKGPIFANIVLADEVNRSPGKVQAALLEAMQERQVTIGDTSYKLEEPFLVMATQNPIDQEGTYPLPEAQVDRFMLKVTIGYLTPEEETEVLTRMGHTGKKPEAKPVVKPEDILRAREVTDKIYIDDKIKKYIVDIVFSTRYPDQYNMPELSSMIQLGASPRASIALVLASKAYAFIRGRGYVTPEDIKAIGYDVLRHRIMPSYEAEAEEMKPEDIIKIIFDKIPIP